MQNLKNMIKLDSFKIKHSISEEQQNIFNYKFALAYNKLFT